MTLARRSLATAGATPTPDAASTSADRARRAPERTRRLVVGVAAAAYVLFVLLRLASHGWDPTSFVDAGDELTNPKAAPELVVEHDGSGYDGQFFYRLARNPFTSARTEFGVTFDRAAYRQQRIGYPLLAWLGSGGGRETAVPWALIGVNLAAVVVAAHLAARLAEEAGRSPWLGLIAAAWPGLLVALARDLSEALAASLLLATVLALRRRTWLAATTLLVATALTRETTLVLAGGLAGAWVLGRLPWRGWWDGFADREREVPWYVPVVPVVVTGALHLVLAQHWAGVRDAPGSEVPSFVGVPFLAFGRQLVAYLTSGDPVDLYQLLQVVLLVYVVVTLACSLRDRSAGRPHERLALVGTLVVMSMLPAWDRSVVFLRWADEAVILGTACALGARRLRLDRVVQATAALWVTTAAVWIGIR